jgi:hypothetical protein
MKKTDKKSPALRSGGADGGKGSPGASSMTAASGGWGGSQAGHQVTPTGDGSSSRKGPGTDASGDGSGGGGRDSRGAGGGGGAGSGGKSKDAAGPADQRALAELLAGEMHELKRERNRLKASTEAVTDDMYADVQQMLEILGMLCLL